MAIPRLAQTVLDTTDVRAAAEFWRQLLGLVYRAGQEQLAPGEDWLNLRTPEGRPALAFQQVDTLPRSTWPSDGVPQQLHLDLTVKDRADLDEVHERVLALGGTLLHDRSDDEDEPLRVYADLDGHPFCVFVT